MKLNLKKAKNCRLFTILSPENINIDEWNGQFAKAKDHNDSNLSSVAQLRLIQFHFSFYW